MTTVKESERDELKKKETKKINEKNSSKPQIVRNQTGINEITTNSQANINLAQSMSGVPLIVNNGIQGIVPILDPKQFGSKPVCTYCPNCKLPITTVSTKKCNCCSCCFCFFLFSVMDLHPML